MLKEILAPIKNIEEDRLFAFLGYCSLLCVVPLIFKKESDLAVFHGRQGLALFFCEMAAFIVSIVFPWLFKPCLVIFGVLVLWGMISALKGRFVKFPGIYRISEKLVL